MKIFLKKNLEGKFEFQDERIIEILTNTFAILKDFTDDLEKWDDTLLHEDEDEREARMISNFYKLYTIKLNLQTTIESVKDELVKRGIIYEAEI